MWTITDHWNYSIGYTFLHAFFLGSPLMDSFENKNAFLLLSCLEQSYFRDSLPLSLIKNMWYFNQNITATQVRSPELHGIWMVAPRGQVA